MKTLKTKPEMHVKSRYLINCKQNENRKVNPIKDTRGAGRSFSFFYSLITWVYAVRLSGGIYNFGPRNFFPLWSDTITNSSGALDFFIRTIRATPRDISAKGLPPTA